MTTSRLTLVLVIAASCLDADELPSATTLTTKESVVWTALESRLNERVRGLDGVAGLVVKDLHTGRTIAINSDEEFPQASSIKLAILYELYRRADAGGIDLAEAAPVGGERAGGDGILKLLGPSVRLSWRDAAVLMMSLSDNAATNLLIDRLGMDAINGAVEGLGLSRTRLRRRMMDLDAAQRGNENVSTPREMLALVTALREGRGLSPALARDLRSVASVDKDSDFREPLPATLSVLDKPGDLDGVRCVTAVVELPRRPYAVTVMTTYLRRDADGEDLIREVSAILYEVFDRLDRAAETGRLLRDR